MKIRNVPRLIGAKIALAITPLLPPTGARQNDGTGSNPTVALFPTYHIFDLQQVVGIFFRFDGAHRSPRPGQ